MGESASGSYQVRSQYEQAIRDTYHNLLNSPLSRMNKHTKENKVLPIRVLHSYTQCTRIGWKQLIAQQNLNDTKEGNKDYIAKRSH